MTIHSYRTHSYNNHLIFPIIYSFISRIFWIISYNSPFICDVFPYFKTEIFVPRKTSCHPFIGLLFCTQFSRDGYTLTQGLINRIQSVPHTQIWLYESTFEQPSALQRREKIITGCCPPQLSQSGSEKRPIRGQWSNMTFSLLFSFFFFLKRNILECGWYLWPLGVSRSVSNSQINSLGMWTHQRRAEK